MTQLQENESASRAADVRADGYSVELYGLKVDGLDESQVIEFIVRESLIGKGGWLLNPNVDVLRKISRDDDLADLSRTARLVVADGMPLIWASAIQGERLPERVAGSTLIWTLSAGAAKAGRSIFLLGGAEGVGQRCGEVLAEQITGLLVVGSHCPPFGFEKDPAAGEAIRVALREARPNIVFTGLGFPKQEKLMAELIEEFPDTWFIGSGASLAFVAGEISRAPKWMQSHGLEWVHRLMQEPTRLFRRYVVEDIPFAIRLLTRAARLRVFTRG